jgi:hypothetical protein
LFATLLFESVTTGVFAKSLFKSQEIKRLLAKAVVEKAVV